MYTGCIRGDCLGVGCDHKAGSDASEEVGGYKLYGHSWDEEEDEDFEIVYEFSAGAR